MVVVDLLGGGGGGSYPGNTRGNALAKWSIIIIKGYGWPEAQTKC